MVPDSFRLWVQTRLAMGEPTGLPILVHQFHPLCSFLNLVPVKLSVHYSQPPSLHHHRQWINTRSVVCLHFLGPCIESMDPFFLPLALLPWLFSQFTDHFSFLLAPRKLSDFLKLNVPGFSPRAPSFWAHPLWWCHLGLRAEMLWVCWQAPASVPASLWWTLLWWTLVLF